MKGTILYANYDEETGVSTVTKATKYGTFTRSVRVHSDDKDIANKYDGCLFAEAKCDIAAWKEKAQRMQERANGINHAFRVLVYADIQAAKGKDDNIENRDEWKLLYRQVEVAQKVAKDTRETYELLKDTYKALIEYNLRTRRDIRKYKNNK